MIVPKRWSRSKAARCWRSRSTRLREFGVREVIVNVHHFADMVVEYLAAKHNFGMRIEVSREEVLLDTGGGLKQAAWFFLKDSAERDQPFLLHNVDVLSNIDFARMVQFHNDHQVLATLAVQDRKSSRQLLFDENGLLCGRRFEREAAHRAGTTCGAAAGAGVLRDSRDFAAAVGDDDGTRRVLRYRNLPACGRERTKGCSPCGRTSLTGGIWGPARACCGRGKI